jgi:hypothetical protein
MSNIVERLRAMENDPLYAESLRVMAREAADEVERLRLQLGEAHELLRRGLVLSRLGALVEGQP